VKLWAVFKREYLQAVRRKSFLVMTLLAPFMMAALVLIPALMATHGMGEKRVLVIDGTGKLGSAIEALSVPDETDELAGTQGLATVLRLELSPQNAVDSPSVEAMLAVALKRLEVAREGDRLDGILVIPSDVIESGVIENQGRNTVSYYARASTDWLIQRRLEHAVNRAIVRERWRGRGLEVSDLDRIEQRVDIETVRVSRQGHEKTGGELDYIVGFAFVALLFIPILLYGQSIMLGIVQEKSERVIEVLLSSLTATELLVGKVLGLAAVGVTQVFVWMTMGTSLASLVGTKSALDVSRFMRPGIFLYFILFFLLGYLIQVCIYAMGGAIANSEREARQVLMPVTIATMIPWFMVTPVLTNPESQLSVTLSMIPIFTPITMFMRVLVSEPPAWQVWLSIALTTITVWLLFKLTAKVFRVGILSYGKRPTLGELWSWVRQA
jgi:ABC-2 type transport system permease protein